MTRAQSCTSLRDAAILMSKVAASRGVFNRSFLNKARSGRRPVRIAKLLDKLGQPAGPKPPSSITNTAGAAKITSLPGSGAMQQQGNAIAKANKPGQFTGMTGKTQMKPLGATQSNLGLPPIDAATNPPPAPRVDAPTPPPMPQTSGMTALGYLGFRKRAQEPTAPQAVPAPPSPIPMPSEVNQQVASPAPSANVWTPQADWRPNVTPTGWEQTKNIAGSSLGTLMDAPGMALGGAALIPGLGLPAAGIMAGRAIAAPVKDYIDREYGRPGRGQVIAGTPTTTSEIANATGIGSKEEFLAQHGGNLEEALQDPQLRSLAVQYGIAPGGFSISNATLEGTRGANNREDAAWVQAMREKAQENPEMYPELASQLPAKESGLRIRNRTVMNRLFPKTASGPASTIRAVYQMKTGGIEASDIDKIQIKAIVKRASLSKKAAVWPWLLGGAYAAGSAMTPSQQAVPGVGGLGRLGLGLTGAYLGAKHGDKLGLPWWLGGMLGAGVVPGLAGSLMSGGGLMGGGGGGGGIGGMLQSPLVGGAAGYLLANKIPALKNAIPGGEYGAAGLGALLLPGMMGNIMPQQQQQY